MTAPTIPLSQRARRVRLSPIAAAGQRAAALISQGRDVLTLTSGEPEFDTPPAIQQAAIAAMARGERGMQTDFSVRGAGFGQALVLVDGVRLNDAQSGHHNGDIPVPLDAIERIEVLHGAGSSLYGADAFGGTINIITRRTTPASASIEVGSWSLVSGRAQASGSARGVQQLVSGAVSHSEGFMFERQFDAVEIGRAHV